jgi:hypothetical protein
MNDSVQHGGPPAPFRSPDPEHKTVLNFPRVVEAVMIAALAAFGSSQLTTARLETRMESLMDAQRELKSQVAELRRDVYRPRWDNGQPRPQTMQMCPSLPVARAGEFLL